MGRGVVVTHGGARGVGSGAHRGGGEALDLVHGRIREVRVELGDAAGRGGGHGDGRCTAVVPRRVGNCG